VSRKKTLILCAKLALKIRIVKNKKRLHFVKRFEYLLHPNSRRGPTKHRNEHKGANLFKNTRISRTRKHNGPIYLTKIKHITFRQKDPL